MSLCAYQTVLIRLATERHFLRMVRARGEAALAAFDLTPIERARAISVASDAGLKVTAALISSFRLGKVLALLPLTRALLGNVRLGRELQLFWDKHPPRSFYALDEVLDFCTHLQARLEVGWRVPYLSDVLSLERAMLELQRAGLQKRVSTFRKIHFAHDPTQLLPRLMSGQRPGRVRKLTCVVVATADASGHVHWSPAFSDANASPRQSELRT